jgi:lipopolysaccharide heptosyltransferase II
MRHAKGSSRKRMLVCFLHIALWPILLIPRIFFPRRRHGAVSRILLIRIDGIGDLVMSSAIFPSLRRHFPNARIDLLTSDSAQQVAELMVAEKWIDTLYIMPLRDRRFSLYRDLWRKFRAVRYDAAIDLRGDMRNVALMWFSGIPVRYGLPATGLEYLLTQCVDLPSPHHQADEARELIKCLGVSEINPWPRLPLRASDIAEAERWLTDRGISLSQPICAFHLGAFYEVKVWPLERFVEVARTLQQTMNAQIVVVGGPGEAELAKEFSSRVGETVAIAAGNASLILSAAITSKCNVFIGNDSGPAHMAASVGCPVVVLFGPADPNLYRPLSPNVVVMKSSTPCDVLCDKTCARPASRCMLDHTARAVADAAAILMRPSP